MLILFGLDGVEAGKLKLGVECVDGSGVARYLATSKSLKLEFTGEFVWDEGEKSKYGDERLLAGQRHGVGSEQEGQ